MLIPPGPDAAHGQGAILKFDGKPLFPERIAYTVPYRLSDEEAHLYTAVTDYVREEFNRAEALANAKRAGNGRLRADDPAAPAHLVARGDLPVVAAPARAAGEPPARARGRVVCGRGRNPTLRVFTLSRCGLARPASGILRSG